MHGEDSKPFASHMHSDDRLPLPVTCILDWHHLPATCILHWQHLCVAYIQKTENLCQSRAFSIDNLCQLHAVRRLKTFASHMNSEDWKPLSVTCILDWEHLPVIMHSRLTTFCVHRKDWKPLSVTCIFDWQPVPITCSEKTDNLCQSHAVRRWTTCASHMHFHW